jgi:hypothetical protein
MWHVRAQGQIQRGGSSPPTLMDFIVACPNISSIGEEDEEERKEKGEEE